MRRTLVIAVALALWAAPARARDIVKADQDYGSTWRILNLPAPTLGASPLRLQDLTLCTGLLAVNTTGLPFHCASLSDLPVIPAGTLLGNPSASSAAPSAITLGSGLNLSLAGVLSATGSGTVTGVTAVAPLFSSGGTTPQLTIQGAITTGGTSTSATSLGAQPTGAVYSTVTGGVSALSTVNPYQVLVDAPDAAPDFLAAKVVPTSPIVKDVRILSPPTTGLVLRLRSDLGVTASGANVTGWADQSGNGYNVASAGSPPTLVSSSINSLPAVRFASASSQLLRNTTANPIAAGAARTVVVVAKGASGQDFIGPAFAFRSGGPGFNAFLGFTDGNFYTYVGGAADTIITNPHIADQAIAAQWTSTGAGSTAFSFAINGTTLATGKPVDSDSGATGFVVGGRAEQTQFFNGDIAEILVYDHVLTSTDQAALYAYVQDRYAISVVGAAGGARTLTLALQGGVVSGSTSTTPQSLGALGSGIPKCTTTSGNCSLSLATVQAAGSSAGGDVQGVGNYILGLNSDVVATGPGTVAATIQPNVVTFGKMQQLAGLSIPGRAANTTGNMAAITATSGSNGVFRESGGTVGFGTILPAEVAGLAAIATSGSGADLTANSVTNAKLAQRSGFSVMGNPGAGLANVQDIVATGSSAVLKTNVAGSAVVWAPLDYSELTGRPSLAAVATSGSATDLTTGSLSLARMTPGSVGQVLVTAAGPAVAWGTVGTSGISNNAVTNALLGQMAANTIKGNNTGATANAADLTATQVTAMLNPFNSTLKGLVPASGGGTTTYLRADGTFATPPTSGGTVTGVSGTAPISCSPSSPNPTCALGYDSTLHLIGSQLAVNVIPESSVTNLVTDLASKLSQAYTAVRLGLSAPLPQRSALNIGPGLNAVDDAGDGVTTISVANSGVTPGTYANVTFTVGADGRIGAASSGTLPAAADILASAGPFATPVGDSTHQLNTTTHLVTAHHLEVTADNGSLVGILMDSTGVQQLGKRNGKLQIGPLDANSIDLMTNNNVWFTINNVGTITAPGLNPSSIVVTDASHNVTTVGNPASQSIDWSESWTNSSAGLASNKGNFIVPSTNVGTVIANEGTVPGVSGDISLSLQAMYGSSIYPMFHAAQRAMTGGVLRCMDWYGVTSGSGTDTEVFGLYYTNNSNASSVTLLTSVSVSNWGSLLGTFGTSAFTSSIPSGAWIFLAVWRSDTASSKSVTVMNFRCEADLY